VTGRAYATIMVEEKPVGGRRLYVVVVCYCG